VQLLKGIPKDILDIDNNNCDNIITISKTPGLT